MIGLITRLCRAMIDTPTIPTVRGRIRTSQLMMNMHQPITQITPPRR